VGTKGAGGIENNTFKSSHGAKKTSNQKTEMKKYETPKARAAKSLVVNRRKHRSVQAPQEEDHLEKKRSGNSSKKIDMLRKYNEGEKNPAERG